MKIPDGAFVWRDPPPGPGEGICDFCSDPRPIWDYPCSEFEMQSTGAPPGFHQLSENEWGACDLCSALIEADDWEALHEWALGATLAVLPPNIPIAIRDRIAEAMAILPRPSVKSIGNTHWLSLESLTGGNRSESRLILALLRDPMRSMAGNARPRVRGAVQGITSMG